MKTLNGTEFRAAVKTASAFVGRRRGGQYFEGFVVARMQSDTCTIIGTDGAALCEIPLRWSSAAKIKEQWVRFKPSRFAKGSADVTVQDLLAADVPYAASSIPLKHWVGERGPHKFQTSLNPLRFAVEDLSIKRLWISKTATAETWTNWREKPRVLNMSVRCEKWPVEIGLGADYLRKVFVAFPSTMTVTVGEKTDVVLFETAAARIWVMPLRPSGKQ